jgi:mRNA-degrading endonuclease toxin of MazEF toxin-antitoxin module
MFYSVPLTMAADTILFELVVRQLVAGIPFEGVAQCDAVRTVQHL